MSPPKDITVYLETDTAADFKDIATSCAALAAGWNACPSSNDMRLFGLWKHGVSGSVSGLI